MNKEYFLFVNGKKIKVSEEIYKVYWQEKNHENYLKQIDRKNHLLLCMTGMPSVCGESPRRA